MSAPNSNRDYKRIMHIASFIHFLAATTGWAAVLLCLLLFIKNHKPLILDLTLFSASLMLMVSGIAIGHYALVAGINLEQAITVVTGAIGGNLFIIIIPPLVHRMFGLEFKGASKKLFIGIDIVVVVISLVYLTVSHATWLLLILQVSMYSVLIYGTITGFLKAGDIGAPEFRRFLKVIFGTTVLFLPFLVLDSFLSRSPIVPYNLTLPLLVLVQTIEVAIFAVMSLDQPVFMEGNRLTAHCVEALKLSAREKEIVESLLKGHTNKQISEELYISSKTVENHLYSVYQKAGVKNRTQLANLIHTNSAS